MQNPGRRVSAAVVAVAAAVENSCAGAASFGFPDQIQVPTPDGMRSHRIAAVIRPRIPRTAHADT
jgi:hypothetical protein